MHKLITLAVLLLALAAISSGQTRRYRRPMSVPFRAAPSTSYYPPQARHFSSYGAPSFGNIMPSYQMQPRGFARMPDGEYYGPHGVTSVDGSDYSFDAHGGDYVMMGPMMG